MARHTREFIGSLGGYRKVARRLCADELGVAYLFRFLPLPPASEGRA